MAEQCQCDYVSPFAPPATNEEQFGRDMAPVAGIVVALVTKNPSGSKIVKSVKTERIGRFTKRTEVRPGKGSGQSRAEYVIIKNADGKTIRVYKDSYDRADKFQHRKQKPLPPPPPPPPPRPPKPE